MTRFVTSLRRAFEQATTMDPVATRVLEQNYVSVKLNSRLWGN